MDVEDRDHMVNKYNSDMEDSLGALRQIYDSLADARKLLLEQVLKKIVVCTALADYVLPAFRMNIMMLDFDGYRPTATADMIERPEAWPSDLIHLFAGQNVPLILSHAYSAVRAWNRGELYTPKRLALCENSKHYPVRKAERAKYTAVENIKRLVAKANEPLSVTGELLAKPSPPDEDGLPPALADSFD
jgi:hypothetical protein